MSPQGPGINLGGLGDIDMYPYEAFDAARVIHGAADMFAAWPGLRAAIDGAERALGHGRLGADFRASYNAVEAGLKEAADGVAPTCQTLGSICGRAVNQYLEVDGQEVPAILQAAQLPSGPHGDS